MHVVTNLETQISFKDAYNIKPDILVGQTLEMHVAVTGKQFRDLAHSSTGILGVLKNKEHRGDFLVSFNEVTIEIVQDEEGIGQITEGEAIFPGFPSYPKQIRLHIDGFDMIINALTLTRQVPLPALL